MRMRNCSSKCALAMDACVHINIACTYSSVQFCEHHLCKLHRHIFSIIFHCTLYYICSFVLCTLLIGGNKELLLLVLIDFSFTVKGGNVNIHNWAWFGYFIC